MPEHSYDALLEARYRERHAGATDERLTHNPVLRTLLQHRTVRQYDDRPVEPHVLHAILAAAQSASSSSNLQAWSVVVVEDAARKARLAAHAGNQAHIAQAPVVLVFLADLARLRGIAQDCGMAGDGLDYLEATVIGIADAALAAQNAVVALESMGLGACYIGAMRNHPEKIAAELALPKETFAVFGLTIGYPHPDVATDIKPRLPQPVVVHREQYRANPQALPDYDQRMREFQAEQGMQDTHWTAKSARRITGIPALTGRHRLREALAGFGIKLL